MNKPNLMLRQKLQNLKKDFFKLFNPSMHKLTLVSSHKSRLKSRQNFELFLALFTPKVILKKFSSSLKKNLTGLKKNFGEKYGVKIFLAG